MTRRQYTRAVRADRVRGLAVALAGCVVLALAPLAAVEGDGAAVIEAVKHGKASEVRGLLKSGGSAEAAERDGTTAVQWAVAEGHREILKALLDAGASPTAANRYGATPLWLACVNGDLASVELLLKAGADPNAALPGSETALMTASRTGAVAVVRALLAQGARPNERESYRGQTALMWAAAENNVAAIDALIDGGADVGARAQAPGPASGLVGTGNYLQSFGGSYTPLLFAVREGHIDAAVALIRRGADVNAPTSDGVTPLILAALNAHWELGITLLKSGADAKADGPGWTALHQVARTRRLPEGFLPHPTTSGTATSLQFAEELIARGVDVNARMSKDMRDGYRSRIRRVGATAFWLAAKNIDLELMRLLISKGANPNVPTADNATPLMVAAGVGMFNPGEDAGTDPASEPIAFEAAKLCLELGADPDAVDGNGETAMHGAAYRGANSIVQLLADRHASFTVANRQGWTPLRIADGVVYSATLKRQPHTAVLLRRLMTEQGLPVSANDTAPPTAP